MRTIIFSIIFIFLCGCTATNSDALLLLNKVEQQIEQYPDSALNTLDAITPSMLGNRADKARYALLKSMALDKNYIDVTSDSLTSVAIAYYKKHGTPDDKMKAYYYNGIVALNNNNYEEAMDNYISAETNVGSSTDHVFVGRLYNAKMMVYKEIYSIDEAIKPAELAAYHYMKGKDTVRFMTALNNLSSMLLALNKYDSLQVCFNKIQQYENYLTDKQRSNYYLNIINYKIDVDDTTLNESISDYLEYFLIKEKGTHWIILARAFLHMGDYSKAKGMLDMYRKYNGKPVDLYYYYAAEIFSLQGDYENAYNNLKIYQKSTNKKDLEIHRSDTKFLEERYMSQKKAMEQKYLIVVLILTVITIVSISLYLYSYFREINRRRMLKVQELEEQKSQLSNEYEKALLEQKKLRAIISQRPINAEVVKVIEERLQILNRFIVSYISGVNMGNSIMELNNYLNNNEHFMQSTILSFELTNPKFIKFLRKHNLTENEISHCCLYCIGLNGAEISNYLNIKYIYKKSSVIREKLKIESVNIETFLLKKMKELD